MSERDAYNTDLAGDAEASQSTQTPAEQYIQTPWTEIDNVYFEARGTAWALSTFSRQWKWILRTSCARKMHRSACSRLFANWRQPRKRCGARWFSTAVASAPCQPFPGHGVLYQPGQCRDHRFARSVVPGLGVFSDDGSADGCLSPVTGAISCGLDFLREVST